MSCLLWQSLRLLRWHCCWAETRESLLTVLTCTAGTDAAPGARARCSSLCITRECKRVLISMMWKPCSRKPDMHCRNRHRKLLMPDAPACVCLFFICVHDAHLFNAPWHPQSHLCITLHSDTHTSYHACKHAKQNAENEHMQQPHSPVFDMSTALPTHGSVLSHSACSAWAAACVALAMCIVFTSGAIAWYQMMLGLLSVSANDLRGVCLTVSALTDTRNQHSNRHTYVQVKERRLFLRTCTALQACRATGSHRDIHTNHKHRYKHVCK